MTDDKILQTGTSSANQHRFGFDKKRRITIRGSNGVGETISYLQTPSIPLCARSRNDWNTGSCTGYKDCLYSEDIPESDQSTSKICKDHRAKFERNSDPSTRGLSAKWSEAWLKGESILERSSWNTAMTDCHRKRSCMLIGFWFLKKFGSRFMQITVQGKNLELQ